jgi:hypothetical protein
MPYMLGAVKPHVKQAAETLGAKHGFRVIYGWRATGSVANSDHPKGLALDFMTLDKAKGDALSADLIANHSAYAVKYIVWWRRSWNPERGTWVEYKSTSNPHIDHVHVSFKEQAGSGIPTQNVALPGTGAIDDLVGTFRDLNNTVKWLTNKENWERIGVFVLGFALMLFGLVRLTGKGTGETIQVVTKAAGKVAKNAK